MTRQAREAISLAVATALGEATLQALVTTEWSQSIGPHVLLFAFLVGPPLFLALLAWRRREHAARSRLLFFVAVLIAVGGLSVLGYNLYRFNTDAEFRKTPNMSGLIVPLVQWGVIMAVWLALVIQEGREKRATAKAAQSAQTTTSSNPPNPSQSS
jgi:glucan phosphoethanolaminetransferase (alkaline phosphatase superfamily)